MQFIQPLHNTPIEIPLVFFPVQAGFPSPAEDYACKKIDLNKHVVKHPAATFFVRIEGDSMRDKGIYSSDLAVVDRSLEAKDGSVIVAFLNTQFTIKELKLIGDQVILKSANKNYPDINIKESDEFEVWGVVTNIVRDL